MNDQQSLRAYLPQDVLNNLNTKAYQMWSSGMVAQLLIKVGVPIVSTATIPVICYRVNLLNQSEVQEKIAAGMPVHDVFIPDVITPDLLHHFIGAAVANSPFEALTDEKFIKRLMSNLQVLPRMNMLDVSHEQGEIMKRADAELSSGE